MSAGPDISVVISMVDLASFMLASGLLVLGFKSKKSSLLGTRIGYGLFAIGTLSATVHALLLGNSAVLLAAALAWGTVISWFVWQVELVGAFTSPVIAVILVSAIFFSAGGHSLTSTGSQPAIKLHVATAILGQSFAILACGLSLLFLWLDQKLKTRQLGALPEKFPAISTLSRALAGTLWLGFIFITLSLLSGSLFALLGLIPAGTNMAPKVSWAILVWVWYLAILVLRGVLGYRPHKVARMSLVGFFLLAFSWFGLLFWAPWGNA